MNSSRWRYLGRNKSSRSEFVIVAHVRLQISTSAAIFQQGSTTAVRSGPLVRLAVEGCCSVWQAAYACPISRTITGHQTIRKPSWHTSDVSLFTHFNWPSRYVPRLVIFYVLCWSWWVHHLFAWEFYQPNNPSNKCAKEIPAISMRLQKHGLFLQKVQGNIHFISYLLRVRACDYNHFLRT